LFFLLPETSVKTTPFLISVLTVLACSAGAPDVLVDSPNAEDRLHDAAERADKRTEPRDSSNSPEVRRVHDSRVVPDVPDAALNKLDIPFNQAYFKSTHNSYSGNYGGMRGLISEQLDAGVRFIEFDFHEPPATSGEPGADYGVGHDDPGHQLWTEAGNPQTSDLGSWLQVVADWSAGHPDHVPITVLLDSKDSLTDNKSFAQGNLAFLNHRVLSVLGEQNIYPPEQLGGSWPMVAGLLGKTMVVISGDFDTRTGYLHDSGHNPAVAMNDQGHVVEVHDSGKGKLWYWTGEYLADGTVRWHRHGEYDNGTTPAAAMNNAGWIVEVHKSENKDALWYTDFYPLWIEVSWYTVGKLGPDFEIEWSKAQQYDEGIKPTIRFTGLDGNQLYEIHQSENESQNWYWKAQLDPGTQTVSWGEHEKTSEPVFDRHKSLSGKGGITVYSGDNGSFDNVLQYVSDQGGQGRIRYRQLLFVEAQKGDDKELVEEGLHFYATKASKDDETRKWAELQMAQGKTVRLWNFGMGSTDLVVTYPATDYPYLDWYIDYCESAVY